MCWAALSLAVGSRTMAGALAHTDGAGAQQQQRQPYIELACLRWGLPHGPDRLGVRGGSGAGGSLVEPLHHVEQVGCNYGSPSQGKMASSTPEMCGA